LLEIKDTTGLGIDKLIVDFLSNLKRSRTSEKEMHDRSASTAGLLSLDRGNPMVPFPEICYNLPETQLLNVFESSQIQMGSFNIGVVAKFLKAVHRWFWFKARVHCILGEAFLIEKSIVIMFTLKTAKKGPYLNTITEYKEIGESSHPLEACKDTVESACFRLIFSIQRLKD
jgi:hypothetical protein